MKPSLNFRLALALTAIGDHTHGRAVAFNDALLTASETSRGTQSMIPDNGVVIGFRNALVKYGSDDRHFTTIGAGTDIPCGVLFNDAVDPGECDNGSTTAPMFIKKNIALFGLYPESLPGVAAAPIPAGSALVADPTTPGYVNVLPTAPGTYIVFGRSRLTVAQAGDPVSIIHIMPRVVVITDSSTTWM